MTAAVPRRHSHIRPRQGWVKSFVAGALTVLLRARLIIHFCRASLGHSLRALIVVATVVGLTSMPLPFALTHDARALQASEDERHAALLALEAAEHGHSHDDGTADEENAGHVHGHDPADHSHQFAFVAGSSGHWGLPPPQRWSSSWFNIPLPAIADGIERPPRMLAFL